MTPEAQLLITGAVEAGIAVTLGWCAYRIWRRRTATAPPRMHDSTSEGSRHKHVELLNELARLIGEHTHSVELFQRWVESAGTDPRQPHADDLDVSSQVRRMRAANKEFDRCAESRSTEICDAADRDPQLFRDISVRFSDHREKTTTFDSALSRVPVGGTPSDLQQLTFESLVGVLESKSRLERELADARKVIEEQASRLRDAERDARIDSLTHIPNRRAYEEHVRGTHSLFERQGITYSIVVFDIDNFKLLNDAHGHAAGDAALQVTAKLLQSQLRLSDRAFRIGGEEFALVLVATDARHAEIVAERARRRIEASTVYFDGKQLRVTVSAGIAEARDNVPSRDILKQADAAMYAAKEAGRNRIEVARPELAAAGGARRDDRSSPANR